MKEWQQERLTEVLSYILGIEVGETDYGTIVVDDSYDENNIISIELGREKFGYFIEKNGKYTKQVDAVDYEFANIHELYVDFEDFRKHCDELFENELNF